MAYFERPAICSEHLNFCFLAKETLHNSQCASPKTFMGGYLIFFIYDEWVEKFKCSLPFTVC